MLNCTHRFQKTLKHSISFSGVGVHSGQASRVDVLPAAAGTGLVLRSAALPSKPLVAGTFIPEAAMHATVVKGDGWFVSTIEHLMASLWMLGIDNAIIEFHGTEVPILDGSALPFVQGAVEAGIEIFDVPRRFLTPRVALSLTDNGGRSIQISPGREGLFVDYSADFIHPLAGRPTFAAQISHELFINELAPARTFGFLEQLPFLRQHNLARGTSLGNTVVIGEEVLNDLRFPDEPVRHKVLDLLGDLSLLGHQLVGSVKAHKTSHNFNRLVVEHYLKHPDQWELS